MFRVNGAAIDALQGWTASDAIVTGGDWNVLRAVAAGSNLTFYINGQQVWSGTDSLFAAGQVGLGMFVPTDGSGDLLEVDWATLTIPDGAAALEARPPVTPTPATADDLNHVVLH